MTALPDIPRLYTALAEALAAVLYAQTSFPPRRSRRAAAALSVGWAAALGVFLSLTGNDRLPLSWWVPCMTAAVGMIFVYLWRVWDASALEAAYLCARAFILAEFAASAEWQLHCWLWPARGGRDPLAALLMAAVYAGIYGVLFFYERRNFRATGQPSVITRTNVLTAVTMAVAVFAVSNLSFLQNGDANMSIFYIRTLVDFAGVLILSLQHNQLREAALQREISAMDNVLHRQYEQYRQGKESIRIINQRYHELKMQIAAIRAESDRTKQDAALAEMESGIKLYETQNKTGNPVLDTLLTAKGMYCQQNGISLTCVANGHLLDFLSTGEICTIVGTALENAVESTAAEPEPDKRLIRVAVYAQHGFVMLRFENYCRVPVRFGPDGLPSTNAHGGYDLKSLRAAAEHRGGAVTLHWENNWFSLRVLLPAEKVGGTTSAKQAKENKTEQ